MSLYIWVKELSLLINNSLPHLAVGIFSYFLYLPAKYLLIFYLLFKIFENLHFGAQLIDGIKFWPKEKHEIDSLANIVGDILVALSGWYLADRMDWLADHLGWHPRRWNRQE